MIGRLLICPKLFMREMINSNRTSDILTPNSLAFIPICGPPGIRCHQTANHCMLYLRFPFVVLGFIDGAHGCSKTQAITGIG